LARSKDDCRQRLHLRTVLGEIVSSVFLLRGCCFRQFFGRSRAFRWNDAQSSGVARLMGERPVMALKALMASRHSWSD
jgi:hypothetical protein